MSITALNITLNKSLSESVNQESNLSNKKSNFEESLKNVSENSEKNESKIRAKNSSIEFNPKSPVVKTKNKSKTLFEKILQKEKFESNFKNIENKNNELSAFPVDISKQYSNYGKGYFLTIPKEHMEMLNTNNKISESNKSNLYKKDEVKIGMLVNVQY